MTKYERLKKVIHSVVKIKDDKLVPNARFFEDLKVSPFHFIKIIIGIMDEFDIEIEDKSAECFGTIGDVVLYLELSELPVSK